MTLEVDVTVIRSWTAVKQHIEVEILLVTKLVMCKKKQGTLGVEPRAYRTAADCSTTELYPHMS